MAAVPDIVAHHFWHSDNVDKQRRALRVAGDAARDTYANVIAIEHFRRLAEVTDGSERAQALLDLAAVLELTGDWAGAEQTATQARELSVAEGDAGRVGWCDVALAETARKHGRYDDAVALLDRAAESFTAEADDAGLARVLHLQGTIAAQHNDLAGARQFYEASRQRRERLGDRSGLAALLSNLGVVAEYEGDYRSAAEHHEQALELRRELGDRWAIAVSYTNLGMIAVHEGRYADARDLFDESMRLNQAVGDNWMVAIAHHNLGNANRGLGEQATARRHYATSLASYREYDDRWALAFLLEDIALLASADDAMLALELVGAADALRAEIDAVRPAALDEQLGAALEEHVGVLPAAERTAALERGRTRSTADALDLAAAYCNPEPAA
jgi:tetratricopeptide (TPR) repeat protein